MTARLRIPRSPAIATLALAGSVAVHFGALALRGMPETVQIAGGGGADVAVQGTAFADLAQGVSAAVSPEAASLISQSVTTAAIQPASPTLAASHAETQASPTTTASASVVLPTVGSGTPAAANKGTHSPTVAPANPMPAQAVSSSEILTAIEDTAPRVSPRPTARPDAIEQRAIRRAAETSPARPQPHGNAQTNATRGSASGRTTGQTTSSGPAQPQSAGNAAAGNYPGEVQRRIARQRLPRVRSTGVAQVSFTVAPNGSLAALGLARSSGSAELDQEAVNLIRRAAPFPPPPAGAQRSFTIPVRAR